MKSEDFFLRYFFPSFFLIPGTNPHGLLTEGLFKEYVIPQLYNIFHVHDCHIRLILLQHFPQYVHLFSREQLDDDIFLQVSSQSSNHCQNFRLTQGMIELTLVITFVLRLG